MGGAQSNCGLLRSTGATPAHQLTDLRGNNSDPRWSPDGRQIALISDRGDHSFIAVYDFGRDSVRYLAPSADRDGKPRWSPDGRHIAFVRLSGIQQKLPLIPVRPVPWAIWVADSATGDAKEIWHSGKEANDSFPSETADKSFYFASNDKLLFASEQDGWNHLYSIAASGGSPTLLTPGSFEVEDVTLSADRRSVIFSSNQDDVDRRHLWRVSLEGGRPQPLTKGETMEWTSSRNRAGKPGGMPWFQRDGSRDAGSCVRARKGTDGAGSASSRLSVKTVNHAQDRWCSKAKTAWRFMASCSSRRDDTSQGRL